MNKIAVHFTPCDSTPSKGYNIKWWIAGTDDAPTNAGNFFITPAIFYDNSNPAGTDYEGFIKSDCGGVNALVYWTTVGGCTPESGEITITGTIVNSAHGVVVDIDESIPCDVTFDIQGRVDDGGSQDFGTSITIPAGATRGKNLTAVPSGVIECIKPTTAGQTTYVYSTAVCLGITYTFILEIDAPC